MADSTGSAWAISIIVASVEACATVIGSASTAIAAMPAGGPTSTQATKASPAPGGRPTGPIMGAAHSPSTATRPASSASRTITKTGTMMRASVRNRSNPRRTVRAT